LKETGNAKRSVLLSLLLRKTLRFARKKKKKKKTVECKTPHFAEKKKEEKKNPHKMLRFDEGIYVFLFDFVKSNG
jgi:hypothetical protein